MNIKNRLLSESLVYFTISEASMLLGIPATTLRHWEVRFPCFRPIKNRVNHRRYRVEQLVAWQTVKLMLNEGYNLNGVIRKLGIKEAT